MTVVTMFMSMIFSFCGWVIIAHVLHSGWGWFITPKWDVSAPAPAVCLGIYMMIGLCTTAGLSRSDSTIMRSESDEDGFKSSLVQGITNSICIPLVAWAVMYGVYCYAY